MRLVTQSLDEAARSRSDVLVVDWAVGPLAATWAFSEMDDDDPQTSKLLASSAPFRLSVRGRRLMKGMALRGYRLMATHRGPSDELSRQGKVLGYSSRDRRTTCLVFRRDA